MNEGWFSTPRKIMNSVVWTNSDLLKLWLLCMSKASYKDMPHFVFDGNNIPLKVGEFITGRDSLSLEFNKGVKKSSKVSASTLYRWLKKLETLDILHIKSTTKYSVISVVGYHTYANTEQPMNNNCTSSDHQVNTKNNITSTPSTKLININRRSSTILIYNKAFPSKPLNDFIAQSIAEWTNDFDGKEEIINLAIKNAAEYSADNFKYVENTLKRWKKRGVKTVDDAKKVIQEFEDQKTEKINSEVNRQIQKNQTPELLPTVPLYNWLTQEN